MPPTQKDVNEFTRQTWRKRRDPERPHTMAGSLPVEETMPGDISVTEEMRKVGFERACAQDDLDDIYRAMRAIEETPCASCDCRHIGHCTADEPVSQEASAVEIYSDLLAPSFLTPQPLSVEECETGSHEELLIPNPMLALMAERDAARAECEAFRDKLCENIGKLMVAEMDKDAARAEAMALRDQLAKFTAGIVEVTPEEHPLLRAVRSGNRRVLGVPL